MKCLYELSIPKLKETFLKDMLSDMLSAIKDNTRKTYCSEKFSDSAIIRSYKLDPIIEKEFKEYYKDYSNIANADIVYNVISDGDYLIPHIDGEEIKNNGYMYYLLLTAGDNKNCKTVWYDLKDKSKKIKSDSQINYEDISILEEHILQENCWYKFNTDIIHSVENIKGTRCIIYCR